MSFAECIRWVCDEFALLFSRAVEADEANADAHRFLSVVCSWRLRGDSCNQPLLAVWSAAGPAEVTVEQLGALRSVAIDVAEPELRARLCDLLWVRSRDFKAAQAACSAYVDSAWRLATEHKILGVKERLGRALELSTLLGPNGETRRVVEHRLMKLANVPDLKHCTLADCLCVLANGRAGDPSVLYDIARGRAQSISQDAGADAMNGWDRRFWEIAASFADLKKDKEASQVAMVEVARTFERQARAAPTQAVAVHFWEMALRTYRQVSGAQSDRERVHQACWRLKVTFRTRWSPRLSDRLISPTSQPRRKTVYGGGISESRCHALFSLLAGLRKRTQSDKRSRQLKSFRFNICSAVSDSAGPGKLPRLRRQQVWVRFQRSDCTSKWLQQYKYHVPIAASGQIEPMRCELLRAHDITLEDVAEFIHHSPFVPIGREVYFTIGIHAGLYGRFIEGLHVLIPQVEHMLRSLLTEKMVVVSTLDDQGIQQEFDLNRLLSMKETRSLLGDDLHMVSPSAPNRAVRVQPAERNGPWNGRARHVPR